MDPNLTAAEGFILGISAKMFSCCGVPTKKGLTKSVKSLITLQANILKHHFQRGNPYNRNLVPARGK